MKTTKLLVLATAITSLASAAFADDPTETFRTLASGLGIYQGTDLAGKPIYIKEQIYGHDLVSAAMSVPLSTIVSNNVLALQIDCDSTTASLVAFDTINSNVTATIGVCTNLTVVLQQDNDNKGHPNREHFVGQFTLGPTGNILGGYLTIAGRLQLNPTNGCPEATLKDDDKLDHLTMDSDGRNADDSKNDDVHRAGVAHGVGTVTLTDGLTATNQVILPFVSMSIRRQLD